MPKISASPSRLSPFLAMGSPLIEPSLLRCTKCQLFGRRSALCFRLAACQALPRVLPLGPALLAAFAAMVLAFVLAIL